MRAYSCLHALFLMKYEHRIIRGLKVILRSQQLRGVMNYTLNELEKNLFVLQCGTLNFLLFLVF